MQEVTHYVDAGIPAGHDVLIVLCSVHTLCMSLGRHPRAPNRTAYAQECMQL